MKRLLLIVLLLVLMKAVGTAESSGTSATAVLYDVKGVRVGTVKLSETPHGVLISATLTALPPGLHAFHLHSIGRCDPPFKSAGGHFNPFKKEHGFLNKKGFHAGDLPNINVGSDGSLKIEVFASEISLGQGKAGLLDQDGAAIVIHAGADDYKSNPAGNAGPRIACGVINQ